MDGFGEFSQLGKSKRIYYSLSYFLIKFKKLVSIITYVKGQKMNKIFIYLLFMYTLMACNNQSEELSTKIEDTNLCIYTNESKNDSKVSFLVELAKINFTQDYKTVYEKSFDNVDLPIAEKSCVLVPLSNFEKKSAVCYYSWYYQSYI